MARQVSKAAWKKLNETRKLAKSITPDPEIFKTALLKQYKLDIVDHTGGYRLGTVLENVWKTIDTLAKSGTLVDDALKSYSLMSIELFSGDVIQTGCYVGAMADYEVDEAVLYIAAGRALDDTNEPLLVGVGEHNVCKDFRSVLAHEIGHLVMPFVEVQLSQKFKITYDTQSKDYWESKVSKYAGTDDHELFGEAFAAWTHPAYREHDLPAILEDIFVSAEIQSGVIRKAKSNKQKQTEVDIVAADGTIVSASKIAEILDVVEDADWFAIEGDLTPALLAAFKDAGYQELLTAGASTSADMRGIVAQDAEEYVKDHGAELVTGLTDTTRDKLQGTIEDAVREGWGKDELAEEIENNFAFGEYRSDLIANNELALAYSKGRVSAASAAGANYKRSLLSSDHDENENCSCSEAADVGVIPFDDMFVEGDDDYDFAPYHVNCQCDWAGVYPGDDDYPEPGDDGFDDDESEEPEDEEHGKFAKGGPGSGPQGHKPTTVGEGTLKAKVHELLSSGHPFSSAELQHITGETHSKVVGAMHYMTSSKAINDKYGMKIVKEGQNYKVVAGEKPSGTGSFGPGKQPGVGKPEASAHEFAAAPKEEGIGKEPAAPKEIMSGAKADAEYKSAINVALINLATSAGQKEDLKSFKDAKAQAMADYKENTTGVKSEVKSSGVFGSDASLYANLKGGMTNEAAYAKWKQDTINEKSGVSAKPVGEGKIASAPIIAPVKTTDTGKYNIVSKDFQQVSKEDFKPISSASGYTENDKFSKEMTNLKDTLSGDSSTSEGNKVIVQGKLSEELKDSPNFQAFKTAAGDYQGKAQQGTLESRLVSNWAQTSGDGNNIAVALQLSARDAFEMNDKHTSMTALTSLNSKDEEGIFKSAAIQLTGKAENSALVRAGMQEYVHGMYRVTQDYLASKGITDVYAARGMKTGGNNPNPKMGGIKLQPISSFSADFSVAKGFKGGGNVYLTKVPASQVLSTYMTGFGCTGEHELTILSHKGMKAVRSSFSNSYNIKSATDSAWKALSIDT